MTEIWWILLTGYVLLSIAARWDHQSPAGRHRFPPLKKPEPMLK